MNLSINSGYRRVIWVQIVALCPLGSTEKVNEIKKKTKNQLRISFLLPLSEGPHSSNCLPPKILELLLA